MYPSLLHVTTRVPLLSMHTCAYVAIQTSRHEGALTAPYWLGVERLRWYTTQLPFVCPTPSQPRRHRTTRWCHLCVRRTSFSEIGEYTLRLLTAHCGTEMVARVCVPIQRLYTEPCATVPYTYSLVSRRCVSKRITRRRVMESSAANIPVQRLLVYG
jgi:hypothetical protein